MMTVTGQLGRKIVLDGKNEGIFGGDLTWPPENAVIFYEHAAEENIKDVLGSNDKFKQIMVSCLYKFGDKILEAIDRLGIYFQDLGIYIDAYIYPIISLQADWLVEETGITDGFLINVIAAFSGEKAEKELGRLKEKAHIVRV